MAGRGNPDDKADRDSSRPAGGRQGGVLRGAGQTQTGVQEKSLDTWQELRLRSAR